MNKNVISTKLNDRKYKWQNLIKVDSTFKSYERYFCPPYASLVRRTFIGGYFISIDKEKINHIMK